MAWRLRLCRPCRAYLSDTFRWIKRPNSKGTRIKMLEFCIIQSWKKVCPNKAFIWYTKLNLESHILRQQDINQKLLKLYLKNEKKKKNNFPIAILIIYKIFFQPGFVAPFSKSHLAQNWVHLYCPGDHSWTTHCQKRRSQKLEEKKAELSSYKSQATISMHTHF